MRVLVNNLIDGTSTNVPIPRGMNPVRIGLDERNAVVLRSHYVPTEAAALANNGKGWEFWPLCQSRWSLGDRRLKKQEAVSWSAGATFRFDQLFAVSFFLDAQDASPQDASIGEHADKYSDVLCDIHRQLNKIMNDEASAEDADPERRLADAYIVRLEQRIEELLSKQPEIPADEFSQSPLGDYTAGSAARSALMHRLIEHAGANEDQPKAGGDEWRAMRTTSPVREGELERLVGSLINDLGIDENGDLTKQLAMCEKEFWGHWQKIVGKLGTSLKRFLVLRQFKKDIKDIWYGYGPLEDLLANPTVKEIMVNDRDHIFIEHDNVIENSGRRFVSEEVTRSIIEKIVARVGRRIDTSEPLVDARLTDGSRVNAVIPPLAVKGPCLTIRRFPTKRLEAEDLVRLGSLTPAACDFLKAAVLNRRNILVAGGTGTGKTTLLNCLSGFIPDKERIVTIEDTAELRLHKEHVVTLETKMKNAEGRGAVTIRDLVKNSLRMRPDRIVVGECRGPEALDMLQAMNTGHDGSMTTLHANTPEDVVLRLEVLVNMGEEKLPTDSIRRQIASAVDVICQLRVATIGGKKRKVVAEIAEVVEVDEAGEVRVAAIFSRATDSSPLRPTGRLPTFIADLIDSGAMTLDSFLL
jgi:pilus assembly protein CpaF